MVLKGLGVDGVGGEGAFEEGFAGKAEVAGGGEPAGAAVAERVRVVVEVEVGGYALGSDVLDEESFGEADLMIKGGVQAEEANHGDVAGEVELDGELGFDEHGELVPFSAGDF